MQGYWNDAERTAEAIDDEGWMHSGDLAVMAEDGYVNIVGRIKDMVIRGGENVYPREVEEFLYTHPDVEDVQVIGVPDDRYGEELMAWVRVRAGADRRHRRGARVLHGQDRPLQDPALRQGRRRVPDDRHRQGPEVQDARGVDERTRPDPGRHRLSPSECWKTGVRASRHSDGVKHSDGPGPRRCARPAVERVRV